MTPLGAGCSHCAGTTLCWCRRACLAWSLVKKGFLFSERVASADFYSNFGLCSVVIVLIIYSTFVGLITQAKLAGCFKEFESFQIA